MLTGKFELRCINERGEYMKREYDCIIFEYKHEIHSIIRALSSYIDEKNDEQMDVVKELYCLLDIMTLDW